MNEKRKALIPRLLDVFVKPFLHFYFVWCHFGFLRMDLAHQLLLAIGPYLFRFYLPFQMRRKEVKMLLSKIGKYIWNRCCLAPNVPSFRIFLKDIVANFHDYRATGYQVRPVIDRRKIQRRYQCLKAPSCCLLNKNHKDKCGSCTAGLRPMW